MICLFRFENKKFATAVSDVVRCIEERIQQWSEYENSLERLLAWLTDAETSLKNYCLKNTLEEKQEQLEKYQVSLKLLLTTLCYREKCGFLLALRINVNLINIQFTNIDYIKTALCLVSYHKTFLTHMK